MWDVRRRPSLSIFSVLLQTHLSSTSIKPAPRVSTVTTSSFRPIPLVLDYCLPCLFSSSASLNYGNTIVHKNIAEDCISDDNEDSDNDEDAGEDNNVSNIGPVTSADERFLHDVRTTVDVLRGVGKGGVELNHKLQQCGVAISSEFVVEVLSQLRNDWQASFSFFLWAGKQPGYAHSVREYHSMISILGKMRKFDTAWSLIDDMRRGKDGSSLVTPHTLLIMIRRYSAVHDVGKAINTFYAHKKFRFDVGMDEFQNLLSALCRYKNVEDAEHLLFCNRNVFPFNTKSFNIILNGWCNIIISLREAKRVWNEMSKRGIRYDVVSYASIMSCYSKCNQLYAVLNLFKQMKERGIAPDRKVYNAVIHALAKGRLVKEALNLLKTMEEKGIAPNTATYNSVLKPMCKAQQIGEAKEVFDEMLARGLSPTNRTFHALFRILRTTEEVFELLEKMKRIGCHPNNDTYNMLIRKFCRWRQFDNVNTLWSDMSQNGVNPDRSAYCVLIHGLFLNQKLGEAYKYYTEMKEKQLLPEPRMEEWLKAWVDGKQMLGCQKPDLEDRTDCESELTSKKSSREKNLYRQPETRKVVREGGFSFWEQ